MIAELSPVTIDEVVYQV